MERCANTWKRMETNRNAWKRMETQKIVENQPKVPVEGYWS